jgi:hypothetical protein
VKPACYGSDGVGSLELTFSVNQLKDFATAGEMQCPGYRITDAPSLVPISP